MAGKKYIFLLWVASLVCLVAACSPAGGNTAPTSTAATQPADALIRFRGEYFSTSGECAYCHTGMQDAAGADMSIDAAWRSSMMANAARDPYYRASVRSETLANPQHSAAIEKKCAVCHTGMAFSTAVFDDEQPAMLPDQGFLSSSHPLYPMAWDGVSCTLCHQIRADNFGQTDSFSGGYLIDEVTPQGQRDVHGRFPVDSGTAIIMSSAAGFDPIQADYVQQSEICAVCHNLFTPYIDNEGNLSTEFFPEQTPNLEWQYSSYAAKASCQSCHMPAADSPVPIANTGSPAREPFLQHRFVGGNVYMVNLIKANAKELRASAQPVHFDQTNLETLANLSERTANLEMKARMVNGEMLIEVNVLPQIGHKFPTSYPSRRAWLHLLVKDFQGKVVFESGAYNQTGEIIGNDNDQDSGQYEPHYTEITTSDQVQIYEAIIGDPNGQVTTSLLRAKAYLKDNRLLPAGFNKQTAPAEIAVIGEALLDDDFEAGSDTLRYRLDLSAYQGPFSTEVELLYQSIGFRWAEKFKTEDNPEGVEFYSYAARQSNEPVVITSATIEIP